MRQFKTESKKLLDLMINSIYTNKEIFLRELISNASDAVDKLNFKSLQDPSVKIDQGDLAIRVSFDKDARTITISDNGIGMTAEELERNLGTIAHSGSEEFKTENAEQQGSDVDIIGQFGVGFYSAFMVASHVKVVSRAYGEDVAHVWESDGLEGYTIEDGERAEHGTDVILTLRENEKLDADGEAETYDRFLTEWGLKSLIQQYSNYVRYPIQMMVSKSRQKPKPEDAGDDYTPEYEDYQELETVNSMTPIWKKRSSDVEQKDYDEFYKSTFHDFDDPARTISFHAEGTLEYDALLFVPGRAPFDLYSKDYEKGLALYSSNVLIMEKCDDLLPDYYNFVRGVVDSADVSLNISRETLQQNRQLKAIAKRVEKKITADLEDMRDNDREAYEKFFENFGRGLKYGIYSSYGMKADELADLLLFWSAKEQKMITLAEYTKGMPEDQKAIYYAAGDSRERLAKMPVVKGVLDRGYDVLLLTQDVDEFTFQAMREYVAADMPKIYEDDAAREAAEKAVADGAEPEVEDRHLELKNDREAYEKFFENFGRGLKYGIYSSYGMKADELADLLLFWSAKEQKMITLAEYTKGMPEDQKAIYYAAGDSRERLAKMPVVKGVLDRGYDVLLLTQDVDEFTFQAMREYVAADMPKIYEDDAAREAAEKAVADGAEPEVEDRHLELKNVATGDLDLATEDEKKEAEDATKENEDLFSAMKEALGDKVEKVAVSARLTDAPACITTEGPLSLEMEKVLQKGPEGAPDGMPKSQRVLELNAKHPVFDKLVAAQKAGDADKIKQYSGLLYDQALLVEGILPEDPVAFAAAVCNLM